MFKKLTVIILAGLMVLSGCSCGDGKTAERENGDYDLYAGINFDNVIEDIVQNGSSDYKIVYPGNASESEQYAAGELQNYIAQATDVYLPLKDERTVGGEADKIISVGRTEFFASLGVSVTDEEFNGDGFILKTSGNSLYICGANDRGTMYGVYDFLEKILNIKFLDIDTEYVPETDVLPLYEMDVKEIPEFRYRTTLTDSTYHVADKAFAVKTRQNHDFINLDGKYGGNINVNKDINNVHNNLTYVSPGVYYSAAERSHVLYGYRRRADRYMLQRRNKRRRHHRLFYGQRCVRLHRRYEKSTETESRRRILCVRSGRYNVVLRVYEVCGRQE